MKTSHVILTLSAVLLILGAIALVFPNNGIKIGSLTLNFPTIKEIFLNEQPQYADIDNLITNIEDVVENKIEIKEVKTNPDNVCEIQLPENNPNYLDKFFMALNNDVSNGEKVRIMHYGDSQIEGDRITSYIRTRLQTTFGGTGQGQIPLHSLATIKNVEYTYSDDWNFFSIIDNKRTDFHNYGLMQHACQPTTDNQYIKLKFIKPITDTLTLYCGSEENSSSITITINDSITKKCNITANTSIKDFIFSTNTPIKTITLKTMGRPVLYSLDLSSNSGVFVDNISLRGSSGGDFNKNDSAFLSMMSEKLNVKLILFQFGVNAVPQEEDTVMTSYHYYEVLLRKQIRFLQKTNPNAAIVMIGISDRSRKKGSGYETNPNIPMIISAQQKVAKECGIAFWNLFEAMGGINSMPSWVLRDKPLANTDFIHFNDRGAKYIGEMFYNALEKAYYKFYMVQNENEF